MKNKIEKFRNSAIRKNISNAALMLLLAIYAVGAFTGKNINGLSAAAGSIVILLNLPFMGKTFKMPAVVFTAIGVIVLAAGHAPLSQWICGVNSMMKTVVILIAVQTLSLAINVGKYESAVSDVLNTDIKNTALLFIILLLLSHLLAGVMSLGSVVVIIAAVYPAVRGRMSNEKSFIAEAITIGYCTLFLWAPGTVTVLMSMQVFDLSWSEYFLPAIMLAGLGLMLGCIAGFIKYGKLEFGQTADKCAAADCTECLQDCVDNNAAAAKELCYTDSIILNTVPAEQKDAGNDNVLSKKDDNCILNARESAAGKAFAENEARHRICELALVLIVTVVGISLLEKIGFSNATGRMTVVSLIVSAVWLLLLKRRIDISGITKLWWDKKLPGNNDLYTFFIAMGLFSGAISYLGADSMLTGIGAAYGDMIGKMIIVLLPIAVIALSLIGIHPFVSVIMLGQAVNAMSLGVTGLQLGLSMSLGCCLSYMVSPFAGLILTMSDALGMKPADICFRINLKFALLYYAAAAVFIMVI